MEVFKFKSSSIIAIIGFIVIGIIIFLNHKREKNENHLLKKSVECKANLISKQNGNAHATPSADFIYEVKGEKYKFNQSGDFNFMQIGDTVLIEYAIEDNSVARVVDKYYMKKYRNMKR